MSRNFDFQVRLDSAFWILIIVVVAIILGFKYRDKLGQIFVGLQDMSK